MSSVAQGTLDLSKLPGGCRLGCAAGLQGRLFLSDVQVLLVFRPRCIFDCLGHRAAVDTRLQGAPVGVEGRACLNVVHFLYLRSQLNL